MKKGIEIELTDIVSRSPSQVSSEVDGETMMMSIEQGKYYSLDEIGSLIWSYMEEPNKVSDMLDMLLERYDVDRETCKRDLLALLNDLGKQGLIEIDDNQDQ